jgi:hypothetical protein
MALQQIGRLRHLNTDSDPLEPTSAALDEEQGINSLLLGETPGTGALCEDFRAVAIKDRAA